MALINVLSAFICFATLAFVSYSNAQNTPKDYLKVHNKARGQVGVSNITWSPKLAKYAEKHVKSHKVDCKLVHSNGSYGENIAIGMGSNFTGERAVDLWVKEKRYYNHKTNKCVGGECKHYTQVVWRKSTQLGCARVQCKNGFWYVSCNYSPRGNIPGEKPYKLHEGEKPYKLHEVCSDLILL